MDAKGFATRGTDLRQVPGKSFPRQRGAALLILLLVVLLMSAAIILNRPARPLPAGLERDRLTARSLSEAKAALMAWAVTLSPAAGRDVVPGLLPFPDRNRDGNYDGKGDCVTFGLNDAHLLGRLPWAGDANPCPRIGLNIDVRDGAGERLWYAVSRNLLVRGRTGPVNSDMGEPARAAHAWIGLRNARGDLLNDSLSGNPLQAAAVIVAAGAVLPGQKRGSAAPGPAEFLDNMRIGAVRFDNADADGCPDDVSAPCVPGLTGEEFIVYPHAPAASGFNDRLAYISVTELMRAVEKRVLGEAAIALTRYRDAFGSYPWLAEFRSAQAIAPLLEPTFKSTLIRQGLLPVHLPGEAFSTRFGGSWRFVDATPTTATRHSGDVKLVPPLADVMTGLVQVASDFGRCRWVDWTVGDCTGTQVVANYHRPDLGRSVTRTYEYAFSIVDDTPRVTAPTSSDVRRRSLSADVMTTPIPPAGSWNVRITDHDGFGMGQRDVVVDADTRGDIVLSDIRYELSVVYDGIDNERDELPEWFVENNWHHFIYAAVSQDAVPGGNADGDDDCATPVDTCLRVNVGGRTVRRDVRALLVSAGARWTGQDRSIGDCDADGIPDDVLCAYFEGDNSDKSRPVAVDTYARDSFSAHFNDQLRIVEPLPP